MTGQPSRALIGTRPLMRSPWRMGAFVVALWQFASPPIAARESMPSIVDYESVQAAVDANPAKSIWIPDGDHRLDRALEISTDRTSLRGPGRLVQQNPNAEVMLIRGAKGVRIEGLTLTRAEGQQEATKPAIKAIAAEHLVLTDLRVLDNWAPAGAIMLIECLHSEVRGCQVQNYSRISVDDRTEGRTGELYGYAFRCIDGTGILVARCRDMLLQGNRVIESNFKPTPELKSQHQLGEFVKRRDHRGELIAAETWAAGYVNHWHQGSAITVSSPEQSEYIRIVDNYIENAAQGIDIHADHVTVSGNMIVNAAVGLKAMHGSRYTLITDNQFSKSVLWAIGLMPGSSSKIGNEDGDSIVTGNIISEFGYGDAAWLWPLETNTCVPIRLDRGQTADNPPLRNVTISGNVVAPIYRKLADQDSSSQPLVPRYQWALLIESGPGRPEHVTVLNNQFPAGTEGITRE